MGLVNNVIWVLIAASEFCCNCIIHSKIKRYAAWWLYSCIIKHFLYKLYTDLIYLHTDIIFTLLCCRFTWLFLLVCKASASIIDYSAAENKFINLKPSTWPMNNADLSWTSIQIRSAERVLRAVKKLEVTYMQ